MKCFLFGIALVCGVACCTAHAQTVQTNIDQALKLAQAKHLPVFIDFSAVWCHSCHEMDAKVLNGADWDKRQDRFVLVRSDADGVDGTAWMKKLNVPALPTYVVLNPDGSERGRLTGEIKRDKFYTELDGILSGQDSFEKLKANAAHGSVAAAAKVLRAWDERDQAQDGLDWFARLPAPVRKSVQGDAKASVELEIAQAHAGERKLLLSRPGPFNKFKLSVAQRAQVAKDCRTHALQALNASIGLDDRIDIEKTLLACAGDLPAAQRKAIASAQLPGLKALYARYVPAAGSGTLREATYMLAEYYKALGDSANEKATYARAIAIGRNALDDGHGGFDVKRDQAMAEVLAEFLGRHGSPSDKNTDLALQKAMAETYPDNAFYQKEYGGSLLRQGHAAAALPYLQRGADNASAQDKLAYTRSLAKALVALNRRPEAEKLFNAALRVAEKQFPEETRMYMRYWKQSGGVF